jgi:methyl-accepting chemotaxis protein
MVFQNLKLSKKLCIAPLVVIFFLMILSFLSYRGLTNQKAAIDDIFNKRFKGHQNSSRILNEVSNVHMNIYRVISWANAKYDEKKIDQLAKEQMAALEQVIGFTKTVSNSNTLTPEEKKLYQIALEKLLEYQKPAIGVLDVASADLNAATMYMGTADDKFQILNKNLGGLLELENQLAKEQYDLSSQNVSSALKTFIIILATAIGLSLLTSIFISRRVTSPIDKVIEGLTNSSQQVALASAEVSSASQSLADGASKQAAGLQETSASIEEMASMTKQNADNAHQANVLMGETSAIVDQANQSMTELNASMKEISIASEQTVKIIKTIDEIAFQTNLLALNAAVEAARAGEAGAGFAVVAGEVRNLAMRAAEAAKNTASLLEGTVKKIKSGSDMVSKTNEDFGKVAVGAKKVGGLVGEIAAASREQAQGIEQINIAIAEMDRVVQQNSSNAEESAKASEGMNVEAEQMKNFVDHLVALVGGSGKGNAGSSTRISRRIKKDSAESVLLPLSPGGGIRKAPAMIANNGIEIEGPRPQKMEAGADRVVSMKEDVFKDV